jgi:spore coat protein CotF
MNNNSNFGDQQIAGDILTSQKYATELYNKFALEAKMKKLHDDFMEIFNQEHEIQTEIFELMEDKNWYPLEMAESQKIEKAKDTFQN